MSSCREAEKEIEDVFQNINKSWTQGRPKELEKYFYSDIVIQWPGFQNVIKGKSDCLKQLKQWVKETLASLSGIAPHLIFEGKQ